MAWTTPKTWASGYVVLAADLNTHLRDNISLTAPAVMTTQGDIVIASGANTPIRLAKSTTSTQYLANTGTSNAPAWDEVALATGVSGTLPVGNGGTGQTSLTTGAILIGNSTSAVTMVTQTTKGQILIGDGSGPPRMLAVGSNGEVLTAASGETTGVEWAAAGGNLLVANLQDFVEAGVNKLLYALGPGPASAAVDGDFLGLGWEVGLTGSGSAVQPSSVLLGGTEIRSGAGDMRHAEVFCGGGKLSAALDFTIVFRLNLPTDSLVSFGMSVNFQVYHPRSAASYIGFQRDTSEELFAVTKADGGSETSTSLDTSHTGEHTYRMVVSSGGTSVAFYLDNSLEATHTANIPASTGLYIGANESSYGGAERVFHTADIFAWREV